MEEAAGMRGFEARRRAAAAANFASFGGAADGEVMFERWDGVAGALPDTGRGPCLDPARDSRTSCARRAEREDVFLRGVTTIGASESED